MATTILVRRADVEDARAVIGLLVHPWSIAVVRPPASLLEPRTALEAIALTGSADVHRLRLPRLAALGGAVFYDLELPLGPPAETISEMDFGAVFDRRRDLAETLIELGGLDPTSPCPPPSRRLLQEILRRERNARRPPTAVHPDPLGGVWPPWCIFGNCG